MHFIERFEEKLYQHIVVEVAYLYSVPGIESVSGADFFSV